MRSAMSRRAVALQVRQLGLEGLEALGGDRFSIAHRIHCGGPAAAASSHVGQPRALAEALQPPGGARGLELGQALGVGALVVDEHEVERPGACGAMLGDGLEHGAHVVAGERCLWLTGNTPS